MICRTLFKRKFAESFLRPHLWYFQSTISYRKLTRRNNEAHYFNQFIIEKATLPTRAKSTGVHVNQHNKQRILIFAFHA